MSEMLGQISDVLRRYHSDFMSPFDLEACIAKDLPSQFITSFLGISALEMSQVMEKMDLSKTNVLAPLPLPLGISHRLPALPVLADLKMISVHPPVPLFSPQAVQIMNGLFHIALGGLLMIHMEVHAPICVTVWYPLWGGTVVSRNLQPFGE